MTRRRSGLAIDRPARVPRESVSGAHDSGVGAFAMGGRRLPNGRNRSVVFRISAAWSTGTLDSVDDQLRRRSVGAPAARSTLLTVLGEYVLPAPDGVWQETLVSA